MPHLNKQEEKIRGEWNEAIYEIGIDTFPNGEPSYSETAPKIADWWLNKLQEELTRERETWFWKGYEKGVYIQMRKERLSEEELKNISKAMVESL